MGSTRYLSHSKEAHVIERTTTRMNAMLDGMHRTNPMPLFEKRVDDRTANKRLQQIPQGELFDHYAKHG